MWDVFYFANTYASPNANIKMKISNVNYFHFKPLNIWRKNVLDNNVFCAVAVMENDDRNVHYSFFTFTVYVAVIQPIRGKYVIMQCTSFELSLVVA